MANHTSIFLISFLLFLFISVITAATLLYTVCSPTAATPLYTVCSPTTTGNFSSNDPYARNLRKVLATITKKVGRDGYAVASSGGQTSGSYGLAMCRGDVLSQSCKTCVADAAVQLRQTCSDQKEAIVWFDDCMLRYGGSKFFGIIYNGVKFYMWIPEIVGNPSKFNDEVQTLLKNVTGKAVNGPLMFGTGEMEDGTEGKLYALAQCTRDLSPSQCKTCLDRALANDFLNCCDGKKGGRVLDGSCNYRYEIYPFYGVD